MSLKQASRSVAVTAVLAASAAIAAPPTSAPAGATPATAGRGIGGVTVGSNGSTGACARGNAGNGRDPATRDPRIEAAAANAVDALAADISRQPLRNDLTVGDFLAKTGSEDSFRSALAEADRVGGVRWIDADLCQVRLRITGRAVQDALLHAGAAPGGQAPMTPAALRVALNGWDRRSFSAVGTNAPRREANTANAATQPTRVALPAAAPAWAAQSIQSAGHGDAAATKLLAARAAEAAALGQMTGTVAALPLGEKQTVGGARQADPAMDAAVSQSLLAAKLTQINYHADGSVDVKMSLDLSALWFNLQATAGDQPPAFGR